MRVSRLRYPCFLTIESTLLTNSGQKLSYTMEAWLIEEADTEYWHTESQPRIVSPEDSNASADKLEKL